MKRSSVTWRLLAAGLSIVFATPILAEEAPFFRGRNINLIVSTDAGTGYDLYARNIARFLPKYIPGHPTVTVQNMTGAGGLTATNLLYNVSPKDGLTLGLVQATVPFEPFFKNKQANFDPLKFHWLGTPGQEVSTMMVWHTVPVQNLEEARIRGLTLGATGGASTPAFYARVITALLGIPIKVIVGYKSQAEAFLAMERGENEGSAGTFYSSMKASKSDWLKDGKLRILLQYGAKPSPELPRVPFALDLIADPRDREVMELASASLAVGRPLLAPPGVPADRVAILRKALDETFADPVYLAECARQLMACDTPLGGQEIADLIGKFYASAGPSRDRLIDIYSAVGN